MTDNEQIHRDLVQAIFYCESVICVLQHIVKLQSHQYMRVFTAEISHVLCDAVCELENLRKGGVQ